MPLQIHHRSYALPLISAWPGVRDRQLIQRRGWLVSIVDDSIRGYGDCAPFPSAGTELHSQAGLLLQEICGRKWADEGSIFRALEKNIVDFPATCHALETALLDLQSRKSGIPLRRLLNDSAADQVQVNAFSGSICQENSSEAQKFGFTVIKLKAGVLPVADEIRCLHALCATLLPEVRIRLDANGAWTLEEALYFLDAASALPIESLEEPLRNPGLAEFVRLQSATDIILALDESLQRLNFDAILSCGNIRRLVLKPGVLGGMKQSYDMAAKAAAAGMESVVTSLVDSAVGIHAACQLAAAVDPLSPGMAHGLATSNWLQEDVARPPAIRAGYLSLPDKPGSGIDEIFAENLSRPLP